jgi:hypothetical protein
MTIEELKERTRKATERNQAKMVALLPPGEHNFTVEMCRFKTDEKRGYDYLYAQLRSGNRKTSDRLPTTDDMIWKLGEFLNAIGATVDDLAEPESLVGRTGTLLAEQQNGRTTYAYQEAKR